jgi:hypothetical protein
MALIDRLWLATSTRDEKDAGTGGGRLNLTMNIDGEDVLDHDFRFMKGTSSGLGPRHSWLGRDQRALSGGKFGDPGEPLSTPIESSLLTNSSVRVGIRTDDAWKPQHVLLLGRTERQTLALAMETDIDRWMSTDPADRGSLPTANLTMPLRLVGSGSSSTLIHRVMLLVYTEGAANVSNAPLQIQIRVGSTFVLDQTINDIHLDEYIADWRFLGVSMPFTRGDVISNGEFRIRALGSQWQPAPGNLFVYGLDTALGRANDVVPLA